MIFTSSPPSMKTFKSALEVYRRMTPLWESIRKSVVLEMHDDYPRFEMRREYDTFGFLADAWKTGGVTAIEEIYVVSRILEGGPKVFRPSYEQCLALEQIEPNLSVADYHQPYSCMTVEFPERYCQRLTCDAADETRTIGPAAPAWVSVVEAPQIPTLVCSTSWTNGTAVCRAIHQYGGKDTIAGVLAQASITPPLSDDLSEIEEETSIRVLRVALNALLLLMHYGHKKGPENPAYYERMVRCAAKTRKRGETVKPTDDPQNALALVDFDREVKLYDGRMPAQSGEKMGRRQRMHWKRGHMRNQPYGPQSSLRKLIVIKPYLVHAESDDGKTHDGTVTFVGGK